MNNSNLHHSDNEHHASIINPAPLKRILRIFTHYRKQLITIAGLILITSIAGITAPFLLRAIIDQALPQANFNLLIYLTFALIGIGCLSAVINVLQTVISTKIGQAVMHDLRVSVYAHVQSLSLSFFSKTRSGEIQARIASDIGGLQSLVTNTLSELARNLSVVIMTVVAMFVMDWRLALFSLVVLPLAIWLTHYVGKKREAITHKQQSRVADMSATVQESLSISGIILARTMGRVQYLTHRFSRLSGEVATLEVRANTVGEWQWSIIYLILAILPALTLLLGGWLMEIGAVVTIGTLVAMIALQEQLLWPLDEVLRAGLKIRTTRALFTRIFDYLDKPVGITERAGAVTLAKSEIKGAVQLENVSFSYNKDQKSTLSDISVDIPAGSHIAIVGSTGSGKSTLGYLLARLYDVDSGVIRFDGIDIRELSFTSLNEMLGVVTQDPYLLYATVAENLRFARPDATDEELIIAAKIAQLHDLLVSFPDGYDTLVGERGYRFSGGEKQRLALARTILRNPHILLLDEATSALDTLTERAMAGALNELSKDRTIITIAHRLSTVRNADQILVLHQGKIVERGTHQELAELGGAYSALLDANKNDNGDTLYLK